MSEYQYYEFQAIDRPLASMTGCTEEFREKLAGLLELRRRKTAFMKQMQDAGLI